MLYFLTLYIYECLSILWLNRHKLFVVETENDTKFSVKIFRKFNVFQIDPSDRVPEELKADCRGEGCDEVMGSIKLRRGLRYYLRDVSALAL